VALQRCATGNVAWCVLSGEGQERGEKGAVLSIAVTTEISQDHQLPAALCTGKANSDLSNR